MARTQIQTPGIDDGAVTTAKIDDGAVTTAKIDDGAVTLDKINFTINSVPTGAVLYFATSTPPTGYLKANGDIVPNGTGTVQGISANFSSLYAILGSTYGAAGKLPDLRGDFIRGWDDGRGIDTERVFGSAQADAFQNITGSLTPTYAAVVRTPGQGVFSGSTYASGAFTSTPEFVTNAPLDYLDFNAANSPGARTSTETRPRNVALLACIRYSAAITSNIADGATITSNIADGAVTTPKLTDQAVTPVKLAQPLTREIAKSATGTAIDFTSIPSWVKRVTVMFNGVSTNGSSNVQVQLGTSSGVTASGYLGAGDNQGTNGGLATATTTGLGLERTSNSTYVRHGLATFCLVGSNAWVGTYLGSSTGVNAVAFASMSIALSGTLDRIRITTVNGTDAFDAGSINILYE